MKAIDYYAGVSIPDLGDKALDVATFVPQALEFGESSCDDVVHESALAGGIGLGGDARSVNLMICAVLGE